jgi:hypothetical protein
LRVSTILPYAAVSSDDIADVARDDPAEEPTNDALAALPYAGADCQLAFVLVAGSRGVLVRPNRE